MKQLKFKESRNSCVISTSHLTEFDYECLLGMVGSDDELLIFNGPDGYGMFIYIEDDLDVDDRYSGELGTQFINIYKTAQAEGYHYIRVSPDAPFDCLENAEEVQ